MLHILAGGALIGKHCSEVLRPKNAIKLLEPLRQHPQYQQLIDLFSVSTLIVNRERELREMTRFSRGKMSFSQITNDPHMACKIPIRVISNDSRQEALAKLLHRQSHQRTNIIYLFSI